MALFHFVAVANPKAKRTVNNLRVVVPRLEIVGCIGIHKPCLKINEQAVIPTTIPKARKPANNSSGRSANPPYLRP